MKCRKGSVFIQIVEKKPVLVSAEIGRDFDRSRESYFGIGLSNRNGVTEELPFDVLGMLLASELIRRETGLETTTVLIADEHAKFNGYSKELDIAAKERMEFFERAAERLGFKSNAVLASQVSKEPKYIDILKRIETGNNYERFQAADTEWFRQKGAIKIGWTHPSMNFDERYFDELYKILFGDMATFVYVQSGKALDGTPMPPYMNNNGKRRLLLTAGEDIDHEVDQMSKPVRAYFSHMLDLLERLVYGSVSNPRNSAENLKARLNCAYSLVLSSG